jgi:hypothetical protein
MWSATSSSALCSLVSLVVQLHCKYDVASGILLGATLARILILAFLVFTARSSSV